MEPHDPRWVGPSKDPLARGHRPWGYMPCGGCLISPLLQNRRQVQVVLARPYSPTRDLNITN